MTNNSIRGFQFFFVFFTPLFVLCESCCSQERSFYEPKKKKKRWNRKWWMVQASNTSVFIFSKKWDGSACFYWLCFVSGNFVWPAQTLITFGHYSVHWLTLDVLAWTLLCPNFANLFCFLFTWKINSFSLTLRFGSFSFWTTKIN